MSPLWIGNFLLVGFICVDLARAPIYDKFQKYKNFTSASQTISQISFKRSERVGLQPPMVRKPLSLLVIIVKAFNWKGSSGP